MLSQTVLCDMDHPDYHSTYYCDHNNYCGSKISQKVNHIYCVHGVCLVSVLCDVLNYVDNNNIDVNACGGGDCTWSERYLNTGLQSCHRCLLGSPVSSAVNIMSPTLSVGCYC